MIIRYSAFFLDCIGIDGIKIHIYYIEIHFLELVYLESKANEMSMRAENNQTYPEEIMFRGKGQQTPVV